MGSSEIVTTGPGQRSYVNPQTGVQSQAYKRFADPIANGDKNGFDIHIYFNQARVRQLFISVNIDDGNLGESRTNKVRKRALGAYPSRV